MYQQLSDIDIKGKRILIREDLNVPMENGRVSNDARLRAVLPTINYALEQGAKVILLSHLGRPKEGEFDAQYSLAPVAESLSQLLNCPVQFSQDYLSGIEVAEGQVVLCENVRFNIGERANDSELAKKLAALADIFVMDAFGTAHRAHASTEGVVRYAELACMGPLLEKELSTLTKVLDKPQKPLIAIVGGSKVSSKLEVLETLIDKVDQLIVGGGIANTFLAAAGFNIGKSLHEPDLIPVAKKLMEIAKKKGADIPLPSDVIVATEFNKAATAIEKSIEQVNSNEMILDIGQETAAQFSQYLKQANTIVWNGPVGVFEIEQFSYGTQQLAMAIAESNGFSLAGGGDTVAAIEKFDIQDDISYISTGGGAFLEFLEGKELPGIVVLAAKSKIVA